MEEFVSNSHKSKETTLAKVNEQPEKKIEKIITGTARSKKKSEARKFLSTFIPEDTQSVKGYILSDIITPMIKDGILDAVTYLLKGEVHRGGRRPSGTLVNYGGLSNKQSSSRRDTSRNRPGYNLEDDIIFDTRGDADAIIDAMNEILDQYRFVSVGDLYDLAGISIDNYTANKYGWTDIGNAKSVRTTEGYILKLPRPMPLD